MAAPSVQLEATPGISVPSTSERSIDHQQPSQSGSKRIVDAPPDGGYGWVCVACCFCINAHTWGVNSAYGVFLAHYLSANVLTGGTSLDYAFIGGLSISQALFISPIATLLTRRYGTRTTLLVGVFFETTSLIGASFAKEVWQLFLSQGLCFGWGMGFLFVGSVGVVPQWFQRRRSLANGIATSGSGFGGLIYSLATNTMIKTVGLAWAFRTLAIVSFTANFVSALFIRDRNKHLGVTQRMFDYRLFTRLEFVMLLGWGFLSMLGYIVLLFSLPSYASSIGLSAQQGSVISALLNLGQAIGRSTLGHVSDRIGRIDMSAFLTFVAGLGCFVIWIFAKSYGVLIFFSLFIGLMCGVFWMTIGPVCTEVVGLKELPSALSMTWVILTFPTLFAEPIALELRTATGDIYLHCQIFTACMYIGATLCLWYVRAWKIKDLASLALVEQSEKRELEGDAEGMVGEAGLFKRLSGWTEV